LPLDVHPFRRLPHEQRGQPLPSVAGIGAHAGNGEASLRRDPARSAYQQLTPDDPARRDNLLRLLCLVQAPYSTTAIAHQRRLREELLSSLILLRVRATERLGGELVTQVELTPCSLAERQGAPLRPVLDEYLVRFHGATNSVQRCQLLHDPHGRCLSISQELSSLFAGVMHALVSSPFMLRKRKPPR
jgi:hypothetical protein